MSKDQGEKKKIFLNSWPPLKV